MLDFFHKTSMLSPTYVSPAPHMQYIAPSHDDCVEFIADDRCSYTVEVYKFLSNNVFSTKRCRQDGDILRKVAHSIT